MMPIKVLMGVVRNSPGSSISSIVKEFVFNHISWGKKQSNAQKFWKEIGILFVWSVSLSIIRHVYVSLKLLGKQ